MIEQVPVVPTGEEAPVFPAGGEGAGLAPIMASAFDALHMGVLVLDADFRIVFVNDAYRTMFELDEQLCRTGANFIDVVWTLSDRGEYGAGAVEAIVTERLLPLRRRRKVRLVRRRPDGCMLAEVGAPLGGGGFIYTFSDVTAEHTANEAMRAANKATVLALADLAEFRDTDTGDHVVRVARLAYEITRTLLERGVFQNEIDKDFLDHLALASVLHDVGKVAISDDILRKNGPLSADERQTMQAHSAVGAAILGKALAVAPESVYLKMGVEIARHHHERFDGGGYPDGLKGADIPLAARIVAVADVFDALTSERPYKLPWPDAKAAAYLAEQAGGQFDPEVITATLAVLDERAQTPVIRWTDAMSVGNPELDRDHRILMGLVNQMALPDNRDDHRVLEFVLDELLGYATAHFAREEDYMRRLGFPELERHRAIHNRLTGELAEIRERFIEGSIGLGEEIQTFIADWLRNHILQEDMRYTRMAAGAAPETGARETGD